MSKVGKLSLILIFTAIAAILLEYIVQKTTLLISSSESLPYRVLLLVKNNAFDKGDLVTINGHDIEYFAHLSLTKKVAGVAGDTINIQNGSIYINDKFIGYILKNTRDGKVLTPIKNRVVSRDHIFVAGDNEFSFDSRYEEFGLVPVNKVVGRAYPLW